MKVSLLLLVGLLSGLGIVGCAKQEPEPEPVRAVRTMTVQATSAGTTKEFAAEIRARTEVRLAFRVPGKLIRRTVELGQAVRSGQTVAQLDPEDLKQSNEAAVAALTAAQTNVDLLSAEFQRFKGLREQGFISAWDLERREAALKAAQAQAEQAKALAAVQRNQASYSTLVATAAGIVTSIDAEPGLVVSAGAPIVRIALDGPRDVVFAVPEDSLGMFKQLLNKPNAVNVRLWGAPGVFGATLRELAGSADPTTRTFQAKADLGAAKVQLGQTAAVLIDFAKADGVIKLPLTAIMRVGEKTAVWIVDKSSMTVRSVPVTVGGAQGNEVIIAEGLAPGMEVVIAGVHVLTPNQKVRFFESPLPSVASTSAPAVVGAK